MAHSRGVLALKNENRVKTPGSSDENTENTYENTVNKHENRPQTPPSGGYPLLRDTVNAVAHLVFFWVKDSKPGDLAEQWAIRMQLTGWARGANASVNMVNTRVNAVSVR